MAEWTDYMTPKHPLGSGEYTLHAVNLVPSGVTISTVDVTPYPTGISVGDDVINGTDVKIPVSGGTDGIDYAITFLLHLSNGKTAVAVMVIPVRSVA